MNPIERAIRRVDAAQQRYKAPAFVFGIIKKYGDDNGGVLAASLAHSGFVSLFPLLLVLVTILGLVASGDPSLRHEALNAVAKQVPLIGHQLAGNVHQLRRSSVIGLVVGLLALTWGTTGLAQAGLHTMAQVWNLPGPARPGYLPRLGRAALFLGVLGLGVIVTTLLTSLSAYGHSVIAIAVLLEALAVAANIGMYLIGFRVLTPKGVPARKLVPGAVAGGVAWTVLQALGTYVVHHFLHSDSVYGVFATVLGLLAWIYLGVEITVYAAEINVVVARRLWPRSIVQPPLTQADRAVWRLRYCKTSGGTTSTLKCLMTTTGQPAPRHPAERQEHPIRLRRPRSPGRAGSPVEPRWSASRSTPAVAPDPKDRARRDVLAHSRAGTSCRRVCGGQCPHPGGLRATPQPGHAGAAGERLGLDGHIQAAEHEGG